MVLQDFSTNEDSYGTVDLKIMAKRYGRRLVDNLDFRTHWCPSLYTR